jgi:hypothetical protein
MENKDKNEPRYESYTDNLRTLIQGKQYAGQNILTTDGKMGYVSETGVIKQYSSPNSLTVLNGCTTSYQQLNTEWDKLGFPIGSAMVDGQSCGNETKYIQSKPPDVNFDWQYYIDAHPDLNLTTEQQAKDHWNNTGIHQGLLPNATILSEMSNVGKIGYVDVNTTLHSVPSSAYKFTGKYKEFKDLNVTGSNMEDCSRTIPFVKYGDQVFMKYNDQYAKMNSTSLLEFGSDKTPFFLRPLTTNANAYYMSGTPIKYGDQVSISVSSNNWYDYACGYWGCKVGYLNPDTYLLGFGPGMVTGGTPFTILPPAGSPYSVGTEIKYNDSFILNATIAEPSTLKEGKFLKPGKHIISGNGNYVFTYQTDGNVCLYDTTDGSLIWMSNKLHTPSKLVMKGDGNLVAFDTNGKPQWSSNSRQKGKNTFYLSVQNDRNVVIKQANGNVIWATNTAITTSEDDTNIVNIGYVTNNNIKFGSAANSIGKCEFTFQDSTHPYDYDLSCDINTLNTTCNADNTCSGFIHSDKDNTWQKIPINATSELYKITDTPPTIFVKETDVDMQDESCLAGKTKFVDSTIYSHYPKGNDFIMNGNQCNIQSGGITFPIDQEKQKYDKMNKNYSNQKLHISKEYPMNDINVQQNNELYSQMQIKTNEYTNLLKQINTEKNKNIITYQQLNEDLHSIESVNKSNALIWGVSSIVLIGIVVAIRHNIKD